MTDRRRGLMGAAKGRLPAGYTELKYLESSGHQYINTNVVGAEGDIVTVKGRLVAQYSWGLICGTHPSGSWTNCYASLQATQRGDIIQAMTGARSGGIDAFRYNEPSSVTFDYAALKAYAEGVELGALQTPNSTLKPWTLFGANNTGKAQPELEGKPIVYFASVVRNGSYVREFVPCIRNSDGKPGMFDLAGSVCQLSNSPLYINSGSGEFGYETLDGVHVAPV